MFRIAIQGIHDSFLTSKENMDMDAFLFFAGFALVCFAILVGVALVMLCAGIAESLGKNKKPPKCVLTPEQKQHNAEVDADEEREDYIEPEHNWTKWADVTAKTDGYSTIHVQERHCLNCGYREFRKQKIKY